MILNREYSRTMVCRLWPSTGQSHLLHRQVAREEQEVGKVCIIYSFLIVLEVEGSIHDPSLEDSQMTLIMHSDDRCEDACNNEEGPILFF